MIGISMFTYIYNRWINFMRWVTIIKILVKQAKLISKDLKKEASLADEDSPVVLTKSEIAQVITDHLLDSIPELTMLFIKKKK
tara:strand:+ start:586 stop:834 length:249 start_codon:yes stop_codon:yes gene_type:complete